MATLRCLPDKFNPLLTEDVPPYDELVSRRRLGQTDLTVRTVQGSIGRTKNLGTFDYAHLRAPLPKGIISGIFHKSPASYFLMRRSHDGYISATGMFKAAFPYAESTEEETERRYIKNLTTTSPEETAGNVWIPPEYALILAREYQITPWIAALLDNKPIEINASTVKESSPPKSIASPPAFLLPTESLAPPSSMASEPTPSRGRPRRAVSPSKTASPKKTAGSTRARKTVKQSESVEPSPSSTSNSKHNSKTNGEIKEGDTDHEEVVKVKVDTDVVVKGDVETTHTHVEVEMPAGSPELPLPEDTAAMIAQAKEMVAAAVKADAAATHTTSKKSKRKAEALEIEDDGFEVSEAATAKKTRIESVKETETRLQKEKVQKRALIGISATLALGAMIPYVSGAFW